METNIQREEEIEIDLRVIFFALLGKTWLIILVGLLMALLAVTGTKLFVQPTYRSTTKMYVLSKQNQDTLTSSDLQTSTLLTQDYMEVIKSRTVAEIVIAKLKLDMTYEELVKKLDVTAASDTRIITIHVIDKDPYQARDIADAVRDVSAEQIKDVMNSEAVNIVDRANVPEKKYSPSIKKYGLIAGIAGCLIVIFIVVVQCILDDTIKTAADVEHYLELSTLGTIPLSKNEAERERYLKKKKRKRRKKNRGKRLW